MRKIKTIPKEIGAYTTSFGLSLSTNAVLGVQLWGRAEDLGFNIMVSLSRRTPI